MIRCSRKKAFNTGVSQIPHCLLIPAKYHNRLLLLKERVKGEERKKNRTRVMSGILVLGFFFGGLIMIGDRGGEGEAKVDELLETLKYLKHF